MVWPFSKKKRAPNVIFKNGESFFEYQCKFGEVDIVPQKAVVAIIVDAAKEFGVPEAVKVEKDGRQLAMIRVASEDGGFIVPAYTASSHGERLRPGECVFWVPVEYKKEMVASGMDSRFGWIGFIVAKIKPEFDSSDNGFVISSKYA